MKNLSVYFDAINSAYPDVDCITSPKFGASKIVLFGDAGDKRRVFKFNTGAMANKNLLVSRILQENNIPAPVITVHNFNDMYFESYEYSENQTFYERIQNGMSQDSIKNVFYAALQYQHKMSSINPIALQGVQCNQLHQTIDCRDKYGKKSIGRTALCKYTHLLNRGPQMLHHCDVTPKNILVAPNDTFFQFLDLDSVSLSSESFGLAACALSYRLLNYDIMEFYDLYSRISGKQLNCAKISFLIDIYTNGRKLEKYFSSPLKTH